MSDELDLLPEGALEEAGECLKMLGHPVRLRIVDILLQGDFPVHRIAEMCGVQAHQASEHLRLLQAHGMLDGQRRGRSVYYQIDDERLPELLGCIRRSCGLEEPAP